MSLSLPLTRFHSVFNLQIHGDLTKNANFKDSLALRVAYSVSITTTCVKRTHAFAAGHLLLKETLSYALHSDYNLHVFDILVQPIR